MGRKGKEPEGQKIQEKEVLYRDGATSLFLAIEETDWSQALDVAEAHPEQVRTWVKYVGDNTEGMSWSMWRRLPIHEACRRQAPAWLVSLLLSSYPHSAYEATQFGELPLHLAVECGAAPEVVNLIIVANWSAIVIQDNSGRLPTDILDRGELLLLDEHRIVHESLLRCHKAYTDMQRQAEDEKERLLSVHEEETMKICQKHGEVLEKEQLEKEKLQSDLEELKDQIEQMKDIDLAKEELLLEAHNEASLKEAEVEEMRKIISQLREEIRNKNEEISSFIQDLKTKNREIASRERFAECLSNDLRAISILHDHDLMTSVRATEKAMRSMVSSQIALQKQLSVHGVSIKSILHARGIELTPDTPPLKHVIVEEEKEMFHEEPLGTTEDVTHALTSAAAAALKPKY